VTQLVGSSTGGASASFQQFLSTHPQPATRVTQIEGWIPEALQQYRPR
jgi:Zn-dependent protease with chaperone function